MHDVPWTSIAAVFLSASGVLFTIIGYFGRRIDRTVTDIKNEINGVLRKTEAAHEKIIEHDRQHGISLVQLTVQTTELARRIDALETKRKRQ